MKKILLVLLAFLFLFSGCAPASSSPSVSPSAAPDGGTAPSSVTGKNAPPSASAEPGTDNEPEASSAPPAVTPAPVSAPAPQTAVSEDGFRFTDYDGVLEALDEISSSNSSDIYSKYRGGANFVTDDGMDFGAVTYAADAPISAAPEFKAAEEPADYAPASDADDGWMGTNVQVTDVDEGDIVKTDGEYIYVLRDSSYFEIYRASGASTMRLSATKLNLKDDVYDQIETEDGWVSSGSWMYVRDMYLSGNSLIFVADKNSYEERYSKEHGYVYDNECLTCTYIYDVSVPEAPSLAADIAQDGSYCSGRVYGGILYLTSCYNVNNWAFDQPDTYIPRLYTDNAPAMLPADSIVRMPGSNDCGYLVITAIDTATGEQISTQAVLGAGYADMYMNSDCICLASSRWRNDVISTYTESVYSVDEYVSGYKTHIILLELLDGGMISAASCGEVNGNIIGQFALDEYDGYLRIVTTSNISSYKVYTDEEYGFVNYVYPDDGGFSQSSGLYILDHDMNLVGSVTGLGEDERVYSVRFSGDVAYFVTYRETDPLFAVDLSSPEAPAVMSALKIPGFSQYLHVYGDGLLFGLGMGSEDGNELSFDRYLKLSMFDVSDPYDVSEQSMLLLDAYYSEALYDHHAIMVSPAKNIIGFATDYGYEIYSYDEGAFSRRALIKLDNTWSVRAVYIGDWLYIVSTDSITVVSLSSWQKAAVIPFE